MIKIAICDDEKIFVDVLYKALSKIFLKLCADVKISTFSSGNRLLNTLNTEEFDIVFMDIDMPELSGFEAARKIRETYLYTKIIFITSQKDLVYESFEYNPFYFVCKSNFDELYNSLVKVCEKLILQYKQDKIIEIADSLKGKTFLLIKDILFIKSDKHYLLYYTNTNQNSPIREREKLSSIQDFFSGYDFIKPHQRFLVNMNHIRSFDTLLNIITIDSGMQIPISKSMKEEAIQTYKRFKRR